MRECVTCVRVGGEEEKEREQTEREREREREDGDLASSTYALLSAGLHVALHYGSEGFTFA